MHEIMSNVDKTKSNTITFHEFRRMMESFNSKVRIIRRIIRRIILRIIVSTQTYTKTCILRHAY